MDNTINISLDTSEKIKRFLKVVNTFISDVDVISERTVVDAKSIIGLFCLNLAKRVDVRIISDNPEEIRAFDPAMEEFV